MLSYKIEYAFNGIFLDLLFLSFWS